MIQRDGEQRLTLVHEEELTGGRRRGDHLVPGDLAGTFMGEPFAARVRYTRTWTRHPHHGWRVLAAHVSIL